MTTAMRSLFSAQLALWGVAVSACAGGVSGDVDGEGVPRFITAAAYEVDAAIVDRTNVNAVWMSAGDACDALTENFKAANDADTTEEYAESVEKYAAEHLPEEYWRATLSLSPDDLDDLKDTQDVDFDDVDLDLLGSLVICHVKDYPREKNGVLDVNEDCFAATEGVIRVSYTKGTLSVSTDGDNLLEVQETDGNGDGNDIDFSGSASYCESATDEVDG